MARHHIRIWALGLCGTFLLAAFGAETQAGPVFFQKRSTLTRCRIPNYDYRTSSPSATSVVLSESAVPRIASINGAITTPQVEVGSDFVIADVQCGPLQLTSLSARGTSQRSCTVSGLITHTGGDSGQLLGGKVVIRMELLADVAANGGNPSVLACQEFDCWVRRGETETLQMTVTAPATVTFDQIDRIRLIVEAHPSR
ncbi:MAG: hypothetical protein KDA88_23965 [Planctomycetaceae bacterium]|nr:hypothetical protein [Planctomycetaceae bacterium]MCB9951958.1 hypothetical protein [Planctomycetaceae bacterium]